MTSFAFLFMIVSMTAVTSLAAYCLYRILTGDHGSGDDHEGA